MRVAILLASLTALASATSPMRLCRGENEVFATCGTACPEFCGREGPGPCTRQCVRQCQCKPGFVRLRDPKLRIGGPNPCVPKSSCSASGGDGELEVRPAPARCGGPNEEFKSCGTACPAFCGAAGPRPCTSQCVAECQCKPGFVRQRNPMLRMGGPNPCVPETSCAATSGGNDQCGRNEEFKSCGTACPAFCGATGPRPCTRQCVRECQCKPGFVRQRNPMLRMGGPNPCVPETSCAAPGGGGDGGEGKRCGPNAELSQCGSACERRCGQPVPAICPAICRLNVCVCKEGFIKARRGERCIPEFQC